MENFRIGRGNPRFYGRGLLLSETPIGADALADLEHLPVALARTQVLIDVGNVPGADAALNALRNLPRARPTPTDAWDWRIGALQARLFCRQGRSGEQERTAQQQ